MEAQYSIPTWTLTTAGMATSATKEHTSSIEESTGSLSRLMSMAPTATAPMITTTPALRRAWVRASSMSSTVNISGTPS